MTQRHHLCITCTCPDHLTTWMAQHLIHTDVDTDLIPTAQAFGSYLDWWFANGQPSGWLSQNALTRRLRLQGVRIEGRGGRGNHLVGYRLTPNAA